MTHTLKAPSHLFAIGLLALTGLAASNPIADLVDCTDSFWAIACSEDFGDSNGEPIDYYGDGNDEPVDYYGVSNLEPVEEVIVGELVTIDNDPICVVIDGGFIVCHT